MPAKLTLICLIHSVNEKDSTNYIIREAIGIVRKEDNISMDLRITSFIPKSTSALRWVPVFVPENVLRLIGKFIFEEEPSHSTLEVIDFIFNFFIIIIYHLINHYNKTINLLILNHIDDSKCG